MLSRYPLPTLSSPISTCESNLKERIWSSWGDLIIKRTGGLRIYIFIEKSVSRGLRLPASCLLASIPLPPPNLLRPALRRIIVYSGAGGVSLACLPASDLPGYRQPAPPSADTRPRPSSAQLHQLHEAMLAAPRPLRTIPLLAALSGDALREYRLCGAPGFGSHVPWRVDLRTASCAAFLGSPTAPTAVHHSSSPSPTCLVDA